MERWKIALIQVDLSLNRLYRMVIFNLIKLTICLGQNPVLGRET